MMTIFIVGFLIALLAVIYLPKLQIKWSAGINTSKPEETSYHEKSFALINVENELRKTILQATGGLFLLAGIFFSWNQFNQTKERDLSDQINKIIALMGDDKEYVKIGAVYSLKQVTTNHKNSSLIVDILTSYLRDHARWKNGDIPRKGSELSRAALQVISEVTQQDSELRVDLSETDFRALDLQLLKLEESELINSHFESSDLKGASLKKAVLTGSSFDSANLENVSFVGADMRYVSLKDATIKNADFSGADLSGIVGKDRQEIEEVSITDKKTKFP